jgi:hypothetical protein
MAQCLLIVYPQAKQRVYKNCPQVDDLCKTCQYLVWIVRNLSKKYPHPMWSYSDELFLGMTSYLKDVLKDLAVAASGAEINRYV